MKKNSTLLIITSLITLLPILVGILLWNKLPDQMATHFGADGTANGWSSKEFAVFGLPFILLGAHVLCLAITLNDPKKKNINGKLLALIYWLVPVVSLFCCFTIYSQALDIKIDVSIIALILVGVLFIVIGNYLPKSKQSYAVGFKLPWTLNNEDNWNRTNRLAGKLFILSGLCFLVNIFFKSSWLIVASIILSVIIPTVYSFILYKKKSM